MAGPYFWVGGSGNTSDATNHWATASGGAPNAANVPTSADDVHFDAASNTTAYTVTVDATFTCKDLMFDAAPSVSGTITFAGSQIVNIFGSFLALTGMTWSYTGTINWSATTSGKTITPNGITFNSIHAFNGIGGVWTLQNAWNSLNPAIDFTRGTLNTNAQTFTTAGTLAMAATFTQLNLTNSTINCSVWSAIAGPTLTTTGSTIILTVVGQFVGGAYTYNIVTINFRAGGLLNGANTFATLNLAPTAITTATLSLNANQTVTGTLKILGNSILNRAYLSSSVVGTTRTITTAVIDATSDFVDFQDITIAGAAAPFAVGTSIGNALGNSGINFTASATQFWKTTTTGVKNWSTAGNWFLATNGGGGAGRVPLPQDDVVFDLNSIGAAATTVTGDMPRLGRDITWTGTTNSPVYQMSVTQGMYGSLTLISGMTFTVVVGPLSFFGRGTTNITSAGKAFGQVNFNCVGGTINLQDAFSTSIANTSSILFGTFNTNNFSVTIAGALASSAGTTLNLGSSTILLTGTGTPWSASGTVNAGTSLIKFTDASASTKTFGGGNKTYYDVYFSGAGSGAFIVTGSNSYRVLRCDTAPKTIQITAGTTQTILSNGWLDINGINGNLITVQSTSGGSAYTFASTSSRQLSMRQVSLQDCTGSGATHIVTAGTNVSGNTSWTFQAARFWVGGTGNTSDTTHWSATSGGAGSAGVPTSALSAIFDANSNATAYTVTVDATLNVYDMIFDAAPLTSGVTTWAGSQILNIFGDSKWFTGMTRTFTGAINYVAVLTGKTILSNGVTTQSAVVWNGTGGGWILQDAYNNTNSVVYSAGSFVSNNQTMSVVSFSINQPAATVTLGTSTVTMTGSWSFTLGTLSAASSTIIVGTVGGNFSGNGGSYGTVSVQANAASTFQGANTFVNLEFKNTAAKNTSFALSANQTVTGTLKAVGNSVLNRIFLSSSLFGTSRTITAAIIDATSNFVDFQDITIAGAAAPWTAGTSLGDALGNSGVTFTAPATQTATGTASFTWSTHGWTTRVPLPQDPVIVNNAFIAGRTILLDMARSGKNADFSACTGAPALQFSASTAFFDSFTLAPTMTVNGAQSCTFFTRSASNVNLQGISITSDVIFNAAAGSYTLGGNILSANKIRLDIGTLDTNSKTIQSLNFFANSQAGSMTLGSTVWTITGDDSGGIVWNVQVALTITPGTSTIKFTNATSLAKTFRGNGSTYNIVWFSPGSAVCTYNITGSNTIATLKDDGTQGHAIVFTDATTQSIADWQVTGRAKTTTDQQVAHSFGNVGGYWSSPNSAANQITGDIQIDIQVAFPSFPAATSVMVAKRVTSPCYALNMIGGGIQLGYGLLGANSNGVLATPNGTLTWYRATRNSTTGDVQFFTSPDDVTYTQLGTTVSTTPGALPTNTDAIEVGSQIGGTLSNCAARFGRVRLYSVIGGSPVVDFNPNQYSSGNTFTAATSEVWTINGNATISATNQIALAQSSTGTKPILAKSGLSVEGRYLSARNISVTGTWNMHTSLDSNGNVSTSFVTPRYWVGGTGNWSDTAHWSLTSGGATGASVPTSALDVEFDGNSNATAYTCTIDVTANCNDLSFGRAPATSGTITFAGGNPLNIFGNRVLLSGMTYTFGGILTFTATTTGKTLQQNGLTITVGPITFNGVGGGWRLLDAFNLSSGTFTLTSGAFDTNGQTVTCGNFTTTGAATRSMTLGASTINCSIGWSYQLTTGLTLTAGTSTINCTGNIFGGGGLTYNIVNCTLNTSGMIVSGTNTFATLSYIAGTTRGLSILLSNNQTVTGTFKYIGNSILNRLYLVSDVIGTQRTITAAAIDGTSNFTDFQDILGAGVAAPFATGSSLGDCLGNSGITFTGATTQTATGTASFTWSTHGWTSRVPLPQDTVSIPNAFVAGRTVTCDMPRLGRNVTFSCTGSPIISMFNGPYGIFGNLVLPSGASLIGNQNVSFRGRSVHTLTNNGVTWTTGVNAFIETFGGSVTLQDALTISSASTLGLTVVNGTFDANNFNVTTQIFNSNQTPTRSVIMGSGLWSITGSGNCWGVQSSGLTFNAGTSTLKFTDTTPITKSIITGGVSYNIFWLSGGTSNATYQIPGTLTTFATFKDDGTNGHALLFTSLSNNTVTNWQVSGRAAIGGDYRFAQTHGFSGSYLSTPNAAANQITGDIQIDVRASLPSSPAGASTLVAKRLATNGYIFGLNTGGILYFIFNGLSTQVSNAAAIPVGTPIWYRVTRNATTGDIKFYTSPDDVTYTQLGTTISFTAGAITSTTDPLEIGSFIGGTASFTTAQFARVRLYSVIGGSPVVDMNPADFVIGSTFTSAATGEVWTLNGTAQMGATNLISIGNISGSAHTWTASGGPGANVSDYLSIKTSFAINNRQFYAGANNFNCGGNQGWQFNAVRTRDGAGTFTYV